MGLEGSETRPDAWLQDIDPTLHILPEALDRVQLGAGGR
jgi:hypothetical protein